MDDAPSPLPDALSRIVLQEEALAARVAEALRRQGARTGRRQQLHQEALALRDAAMTSSEADRGALVGQLQGLRATQEAVDRVHLPDAAAPYFAHLRIWTGQRERDVLLGEGTLMDAQAGVTIADWRAGGPMARVFFNHAQGEEYAELEPGSGRGPTGGAPREVEGQLRTRRLVRFEAGQLAGIEAPEATLTRRADGTWWAAPPEPDAAAWLGTGGRSRVHALDPVRLDPTQRDAVGRPADRSLLVLGDAGCGKTTVALHRLAHLVQHAGRPDATAAREALVVVPERGLARLMERLLAALGLSDTPVQVFDDWVLHRTRRLVPGLPKRICRDAPAAVVRFKRHPALWRAIPGYVETLGRRLAVGLDRTLACPGRVAALWAAQPEAPLAQRFAAVEAALMQAPQGLPPKEIARAFEPVRHRLARVHEDLPLLLGDATLLQGAVQDSGGALGPEAADAVLRHVRDQLIEPDDVAYAHVREDRRTALDERALDEGTPAALAGSVDLEDCALLLALRRRMVGPPDHRYRAVRWLVVDEAQDLAAVELAALADARRAGGATSVAGDPEQQIDPTLGFAGWDDVLRALDVADAEVVTLRTSYRCPAAVTALAAPLRTSADALPDRPDAAPAEAPVRWTRVAGAGARAARLVDRLRDLVDREPDAQVAIIARRDDTAEACFAGLRLSHDLECRLVLDGEFPFAPGVDVTTAAQVKGLEFDYVVLPDVDAATYPARANARRQLYVALTRTVQQLWLLHDGRCTPLLDDAG